MTKFKDLTDADKAFIKIVHANQSLPWQNRMDTLKERFGVAERAIRVWISKLGYSKYQEIENEQIRVGKIRGSDPSKKVKFITWAQNATPIHETFFKNILVYADFRDAEVFVINGRYQNPTSLYSESMAKAEWWDPKLVPYLCGSRITAHKDLQILGDVPIVATAEDPLSGLEGMSGGKSCVIGHPRVHLRSLPVLNGHHRKIMMTTGAVTLSNYTDTKLGKKGEFHHTYGFAIVEIKDDEIHYVRQVTATPEGTFSDLVYNVDGEVYELDSAAAFIFGDLHGDDVESGLLEEAKLFIDKVRPEKVFIHDALNGASVNRHELNDPVVRYQRYKEGKHLIGEEIERLITLIEKYKLTDYGLHIVRSNHDAFIERWIQEADWKKDIPNSKEYLEYSLALLDGKAPKGILPYMLEKHFGKKIRCLNLDDSVVVHDFELGQHGHLGSNGSRGGMEVFRKLNTKMIVGHGHGSHRRDGVLMVGTNTVLRAGYNHGASDWSWSNSIIHDDKKAQHLIFSKDKRFTTIQY